MTGWAAGHIVMALVAAPLLPATATRVKALMAGRRGQPLFQPYFDLAKLLRKGAVYPPASTWVFRAGPAVSLGAVAASLLVVPFGGASAPVAFSGDAILFVYLLALSRVATIAAALDTGSSFEGMGASREATFGALVEPALLLALAAAAREAGGVSLSVFLHPLGDAASARTVLILGALAVVFLAENARLPIDDPNTHLELTMVHEVMVLDHGGPDLGLIQYTASLKLWITGALIVGLAVPQPGDPAWIAFLLAVGGIFTVAAATGFIESFVPRLRMASAPQFLLAGTVLAATALLLGLA